MASARFVGRDAELSELRIRLSATRAGEGNAVVISGELGIGKTRLIQEIAGLASEQGCATVEGHWYESRQVPAYVGFRECLWHLLGNEAIRLSIERDDPYIRDLVRLGPEFATALRLEVEAPEDSEDPYRLWKGVALLLTAACTMAPVALVLDDLQWADPGSLELLGFLGRETGALPLLIVGAYRDDIEPGHPLFAALSALRHGGRLTTIHLEGLGREETCEIARHVAGKPIEPPAMERLCDLTKGNPLLVEEMVRQMAADAPNGSISSLGKQVPEGIQEIMNRRFLALSPECQYLLQIAACLGRQFELSLVGRISVLDERELQGLLNEAIDASVVQEAASDQFAFHHPLMREVVYGAMPSANKLAIHQRIAAALEHYYQAATARHAREIANHLISAGSLADPGKVVTYCAEGARQARALFAFDEARRLVQAGLGALDRLPEPLPRLRAHLLKQSGYVETIAGRPDQALAVYREALALYKNLGDGEGSTDVHRWISTTLVRYGRWAEALAASREGLGNARECRTHAYIGLTGTHALAALMSGELEESEDSAKRLLDLSFDNETRAVAHHTAAGQHSWGMQDPSQAFGHFDESRRLFLKEGRDATSAQVALDEAYAAYSFGQFAKAAEAASESLRLATATGRVSVVADLLGLTGIMRTHQGAWVEASDSFEQWREMRSSLGGSTIYGQMAQRAIALEHLWRRGPAAVSELLAAAPQPLPNEPLGAFLLALSDQRELAAQRVAAIKQVLPEDGAGLLWLSYALPLLATCARLGDLEGARWADAVARYSGGVFDWFAVDIELGRIAALEKCWAEAEEYFRRAEETCASAEMRCFLGQAYAAHGVMLLERREGDDRRQAARLLGDAVRLFEELGLDYLAERANRLLAKPVRGRPFRRGPSGLTEREMTVLRLLADGCSNREMAKALFISEKTVAHHLESVYTKLDVKSRAAAIAWLHRSATGDLA